MKQNFYLMIIILSFSVSLFSQSLNWSWAKSAGAGSDDESNGICTDKTGNVYIAGYFESASIVFGSNTLINAGSIGTKDIFIVKYDPSGNVLWAKREGGVNSDEATGIAAD